MNVSNQTVICQHLVKNLHCLYLAAAQPFLVFGLILHIICAVAAGVVAVVSSAFACRASCCRSSKNVGTVVYSGGATVGAQGMAQALPPNAVSIPLTQKVLDARTGGEKFGVLFDNLIIRACISYL